MLNWDEERTAWAPQFRKGTWGSCFDGVGLRATQSASLLSTGQCPPIKCSTSNNDEGYCLKYEPSHVFMVQGCPRFYHCGSRWNGDYDLAYSSILCVADRKKRLNHKGEGCWVDKDCYSSNCGSDKRCSAYSSGAICKTSNECDKGLICA